MAKTSTPDLSSDITKELDKLELQKFRVTPQDKGFTPVWEGDAVDAADALNKTMEAYGVSKFLEMPVIERIV
jgi:hypothetical protein